MEATTTKEKVNPFAQAKQKPTAKTASETKSVIKFDDGGKIKRLMDLREVISDSEAEAKMIEGEVKDFGRQSFCDQYKARHSRPESFILEGADGGRCMILAIDKYITVSPEKQAMIESIDPGLLSTEKEYSFNTAILEKHFDVISKALMSAKIPDEDKANLLVLKDKVSVKKGAIDCLYSYGDKLHHVFMAIDPIIQLKNAR